MPGSTDTLKMIPDTPGYPMDAPPDALPDMFGYPRFCVRWVTDSGGCGWWWTLEESFRAAKGVHRNASTQVFSVNSNTSAPLTELLRVANQKAW